MSIGDDMFQIDPSLDISSKHLMKLFNLLDKNRSGLSADQLHVGLTAMWSHQDNFSPEGLSQLIGTLNADSNGIILQQAFVQGIQEYAAAHCETFGTIDEAFVCDYSPSSLRIERLITKPEETGAMLNDVLKETISPDTVRWLHISGPELEFVILRIASQYHLSQLFVDRGGPNDFFEPKVLVNSKVLYVDLEEITSTVDSVSIDDEKMISVNSLSVVFSPASNLILTISSCASKVARVLKERVTLENSKLRLNGAAFFVHSLIESVADEVYRVLKLLESKLYSFQKILYDGFTIDLETIFSLNYCLGDVSRMEQWTMSHLTLVHRLAPEFRRLISAEENLEWALGGLAENLLTQKRLIERCSAWGKNLSSILISDQKTKMSHIVLTFSIVSTLFQPIGFLAGVYGMNFDYLPELEWKGSYGIFWLVTVILFILTIYVLYRVLSTKYYHKRLEKHVKNALHEIELEEETKRKKKRL